MGRPGQPCEVAPSYVFLASEARARGGAGEVARSGGDVFLHEACDSGVGCETSGS